MGTHLSSLFLVQGSTTPSTSDSTTATTTVATATDTGTASASAPVCSPPPDVASSALVPFSSLSSASSSSWRPRPPPPSPSPYPFKKRSRATKPAISTGADLCAGDTVQVPWPGSSGMWVDCTVVRQDGTGRCFVRYADGFGEWVRLRVFRKVYLNANVNAAANRVVTSPSPSFAALPIRLSDSPSALSSDLTPQRAGGE